MARIFKEKEHAAKRKEILDAALKLIYTKGYEQMTIQDILDEIGISKGAFYHYFVSKGAVMGALIERMVVEETLPMLIPIVEDPNLSALEKFNAYVDRGVRWKTSKKAFMRSLMRVWFSDDNILVRQKMFDMTVMKVSPLLTKIIRQGVEEGIFTTRYPEEMCHVMIHILDGLSNTFFELLISFETDHEIARIENGIGRYIAVLTDAIERIFGAQTGTLKLIDIETMMEWFVSPDDETVVSSAKTS